MSKKITEQDFYLDKPAMLGIRGWSLLIPSVLAAIGFCAFAVLAFSFGGGHKRKQGGVE